MFVGMPNNLGDQAREFRILAEGSEITTPEESKLESTVKQYISALDIPDQRAFPDENGKILQNGIDFGNKVFEGAMKLPVLKNQLKAEAQSPIELIQDVFNRIGHILRASPRKSGDPFEDVNKVFLGRTVEFMQLMSSRMDAVLGDRVTFPVGSNFEAFAIYQGLRLIVIEANQFANYPELKNYPHPKDEPRYPPQDIEELWRIYKENPLYVKSDDLMLEAH